MNAVLLYQPEEPHPMQECPTNWDGKLASLISMVLWIILSEVDIMAGHEPFSRVFRLVFHLRILWRSELTMMRAPYWLLTTCGAGLAELMVMFPGGN